MSSPKEHPTENRPTGRRKDTTESAASLGRQLNGLCKTRTDKLRVAASLLQKLLEDQPSGVEWALTDADGKVFAYLTPAEEWLKRRISTSRVRELAKRSRRTVEPEPQTTR
jgi:hypothetical protein